MTADEHFADSRTVRPYTITGGRTRGSGHQLSLETIVRARGPAGSGGSLERRSIMALAANQVLSAAEISAHLGLPFGVTRVLISDLADEGLVSIGGGAAGGESSTSPDALLLETVLHALNSL